MMWGRGIESRRDRAANGGGVRRLIALLAATTALGSGSVGLASPVFAAPPTVAQQAQADRVQAFAIPAQPLAQALAAFGQQAGVQVSTSGDVVRGVMSPGAQGTLTLDQAMARLLDGTGVLHRWTDASTVTLSAVDPDGSSTLLSPITVAGASETALGPVDGVVAHRSMAGTKTDTPLIETTQSISVVTRQSMDTRGVRSVGEALGYSAGVTTGTRGDSSGLGGDNIAIRGFGGAGTAGASDNEYWNGLRMRGTNYAVSGIDPFLLERVDVVRGPASVLYGQNQPGGVVNHVSKRPPDQWQGRVQAEGGSFDTWGVAGDIGGPFSEDGTMAFRVAGLLSDGDAQTDYTGKTRQAVAPSLSWEPDPDTRVVLLTTFQHDDFDGGFVKYVPAAGSLYDNPNGKIARSLFTGDPNYDEWDRTLYAVGYEAEHRFSPVWQVRQNGRYTRNELDMESVYAASLQADGRTLNRTAFGALEHANAYALDTQAQADFGTGPVDHTLLMGADLQRTISDTTRRFAAAPTLDLFAPVYGVEIAEPPVYQNLKTRSDQIGLYAQDQMSYDGWLLNLAGRYDWAFGEVENRLTGINTNSNAQAFTGRAGLGYAFDFGLTPYFSYSESFEPSSGTDVNGDSFDPTTGTQYEIGLKYQPPGVEAFITLTGFHLTQKNVLTSDTANPGFSVQTGEVRSRGVELEAVATPLAGWNVTASYTFLDQTVTQSNDGDEGNRLTGVPRHSAALWSDYTFTSGALAGLGVGGGVRYVGSTVGDTANSFDVPAVTLFDATISYAMGNLLPQMKGAELRVNAQNLADKEYVASCLNAARCYYGVGRTVMARLSYEW